MNTRMKNIVITMLLLFSTVLYAYDFSSYCTTGQILYYNIIDSFGYRVSVIYPGPSIDSAYLNYDQPSGDLVIPGSVIHNGQQYLVTEIESCAFAKCTGLNGKLELPNSITSIGSYAFLHCGNIQLLYFNCERCTSAFAAFEGCAFDTIYLGDSVTVIPDGIFANSSGITTLQIPPSVQTIGARAFYNCHNLSRINFSDSVVAIGEFAFSDCPMIETLNQINADSMGEYAFWGSRGLHSLSIGSDVREIGDFAFFLANVIDTVYCWAPNPPLLGEHSFSDCLYADCLVVDCPSKELYQSAPVWNGFQHIEADTSFVIEATTNQPDCGFVTGSDDGICFGVDISVEAIPFDGYLFDKWSDGDSSNPRVITIQSDTIVAAQFAVDATVGLGDVACCEKVNVATSGRTLYLDASCPSIFHVFDVLGRCYYHSVSKEEKVSCTLPTDGVFVVVVGNGFVKKIIVI